MIAASYDTVFLVIFSGTSTVFHIGYAILNSYQQGTKVPLLHILANICFIYINKYIYICWLGFHFSDTDWYWALFLYILITSMSSMKKCLLKLFTHFLNSIICLLLFSSWVVLVSYIFCILDPYSVTKFADTSSHNIGCLFIL